MAENEEMEMGEELDEASACSRRDFASKAIAAASGAAVAGIIASAMGGEAEAQPRPVAAPGLQPVGTAPIKFQSLEKSRMMQMASKDIAKTLAAENMIPRDKAGQVASVTLSISWD